jgi:hypothetical protein
MTPKIIAGIVSILKSSYNKFNDNKAYIAFLLMVILFIARFVVQRDDIANTVLVIFSFTIMSILFDIHTKLTEIARNSIYTDIHTKVTAIVPAISILSDIHTKINAAMPAKIFDCLVAAKQELFNELRKVAETQEQVTIRYFGIVGNHWHDIEPDIQLILDMNKSVCFNIKMLLLDDKWPQLSSLNYRFPALCTTVQITIEQFRRRNRKIFMADTLSSFEVRLYRHHPHIWGICIDESTLFLGHTFWEKIPGDTEQTGEVWLRGGSNPIELIKLQDNKLAHHRISDFVGWFEYYWNLKPPSSENQQG